MTACLFALSFLRAFLEALRSFNDIPPDCAFGTWVGLVAAFATGTLGVLIFGTFGGISVLAKATTFLGASTTGVAGCGIFTEMASGSGLAGSLSFVGGLSVTREDLIGGPPDLMTLGALTGTLTAGNGAAFSITGVLGI